MAIHSPLTYFTCGNNDIKLLSETFWLIVSRVLWSFSTSVMSNSATPDHSMLGFLPFTKLLEFAQTHVH